MTTEARRSVLVVIPTLNEVNTIEGVIEALCVDPPAEADIRFVVADGGSTDGTIERVRSLMAVRSELSLLHNPKRIQSAAVNQAVRTFGGGSQVLVRCDAHAIYPPGFVRRLLDTLDRTGSDAVVVPMDSVGRTCLERAVAWVSDTPLGSGGSAHRGGKRSGFIDHGHHAAFRMTSFSRAGGYDESFTHNEDAELDCRQRALGSRVYLDADIRLAYHPRGTFSGLSRQYFGYGRGRARTIRRHRGSMRLRQFAVPTHCLSCLLAFGLAPWWPLALVWPGLYGLALGAASALGAVRERSICGLLAGPAAAVMHGAWAAGFIWSLVSVRETRWQSALATPLWSSGTPPQVFR
ncbi:MAG: glycosyltransferase family 2 protein [Rhizobacter sp.]